MEDVSEEIVLINEENVNESSNIHTPHQSFKIENDGATDQRSYIKSLLSLDKDVAFLRIEPFANLFVNKLIYEAVDEVRDRTDTILEFDLLKSGQPIYENISWPTISEFTIEMGMEKVDAFMDLWDTSEEWLHCIDFIAEESDVCSFYYLYEVRWSQPLFSYPIPLAVASVFFTIEVSKIKPPTYPVEVTYVLECSRFVHTPGKIHFHEKWLYDIIDSKTTFYKTLTF